MKNFGEIDLHLHTTFSDGTDTPEGLLDRVREVGLKVFSVTDIDSIQACRTLRTILTENDPALINGVEFSCKDEFGQYHILGYHFDMEAEPIWRLMEAAHEIRLYKIRSGLDYLKKEFGVRFPPEENESLLRMENPGKQHLAQLMVKYSYATTMEQAFERYVKKIRYRREYLRPEDVIRDIRAGGGIPVLAHPSFGRGDQNVVGKELDRRIGRLKEQGLQGVEAYYAGFSERLRKEVLTLARRYDLYVTAGSNYHGTNKMALIGNTGLKSLEEAPEGLQRFLADIREKGVDNV